MSNAVQRRDGIPVWVLPLVVFIAAVTSVILFIQGGYFHPNEARCSIEFAYAVVQSFSLPTIPWLTGLLQEPGVGGFWTHACAGKALPWTQEIGLSLLGTVSFCIAWILVSKSKITLFVLLSVCLLVSSHGFTIAANNELLRAALFFSILIALLVQWAIEPDPVKIAQKKEIESLKGSLGQAQAEVQTLKGHAGQITVLQAEIASLKDQLEFAKKKKK